MTFPLVHYMSHLMTKPTIWLCALRTLRSARPPAQSDQSLRCPYEESLGPLSAQRRLCSDWADVQADMSLCWGHSHYIGLSRCGSYLKLSNKLMFTACLFHFNGQKVSKPALVAQSVECPLRGTGGHGLDPGPLHVKVVAPRLALRLTDWS